MVTADWENEATVTVAAAVDEPTVSEPRPVRLPRNEAPVIWRIWPALAVVLAARPAPDTLATLAGSIVSLPHMTGEPVTFSAWLPPPCTRSSAPSVFH